MIPVFAKTVMHAPQASAWLLTASNLGELIGAVLLLKLAARFKGPSVWVKYGALGLLLIWTLASTTALPILLPLILVSSMSWAASDLSLRSEVQSSVAEKDQPRAMSFLYGALVLGSSAASFAIGAVLDALGAGPALSWICGVITALALAVFFGSRKIKK
jgi:predicted MFS family arabinose efflux permease